MPSLIVVPPAATVGVVYLVSNAGHRLVFSSLRALSNWLCARVSRRCAAARRWDLSIGPAFRVRVDREWLGEPYYREYGWVVEDREGRRLDPDLIPVPLWVDAWRRRKALPDPVYRVTPVPHTRGSRRGRHSDYLRYPKTQSARRAGLACQEDGEPIVRGARRAPQLPTAWDDQIRCCQRSWKAHRKTQWKPND